MEEDDTNSELSTILWSNADTEERCGSLTHIGKRKRAGEDFYEEERKLGRGRKRALLSGEEEEAMLLCLKGNTESSSSCCSSSSSVLFLGDKQQQEPYNPSMFMENLKMAAGVQECNCNTCVSCSRRRRRQNECAVGGCELSARRIGLCYKHYQSRRTRCQAEGCKCTSVVLFQERYYCSKHVLQANSRCIFCAEKPAHALPFPACARHYLSIRRWQIPERQKT